MKAVDEVMWWNNVFVSTNVHYIHCQKQKNLKTCFAILEAILMLQMCHIHVRIMLNLHVNAVKLIMYPISKWGPIWQQLLIATVRYHRYHAMNLFRQRCSMSSFQKLEFDSMHLGVFQVVIQVDTFSKDISLHINLYKDTELSSDYTESRENLWKIQ